MSSEDIQPSMNIRRVFVKDASLEMPSGAAIFNEEWKPEVKLDVAVRNSSLDDEHYEVTLTVTVKVETAGKTAFLIEVHQSGVFSISGMDQEQLSQTLGAFCPNFLFPYAREAVDNLAGKASFPPLMLAPINFDEIYDQNRQNQSVEQSGQSQARQHH